MRPVSQPAKPLRVVFDCSIYLQAILRRDGPAGRCFDLVEEGRVELLTSDAVLAEVRDVLSRPELKPRRRGRLTDALVRTFLDWVTERANHIAEVPSVFKYQRDPDDEPYVDLAVTAGASFLVTRDRDLLDLIRPGSADGERLRLLAPDLVVADPVDFLRAVYEEGDE